MKDYCGKKSLKNTYDGNKSSHQDYDCNISPEEMYGDNKSPYDVNDGNKPSQNVYDDNKFQRKLYDVNKSPLNAYDSNKPLQNVYDDNKSPQKVYDGNKTSQNVNDENKFLQKVHDGNKFPQKVNVGNKSSHKVYDGNKSSQMDYAEMKPGNETVQKEFCEKKKGDIGSKCSHQEIEDSMWLQKGFSYMRDYGKKPTQVYINGKQSIKKKHNACKAENENYGDINSAQKENDINKSLQGECYISKESVQKGSQTNSTVGVDRICQEKEVPVFGCMHWFPLERGNGSNLVVQMASKINPEIGKIVSRNGTNYLIINALYSGSIESNFCKEFCYGMNGEERVKKTCTKNILISCNLKQTIPGLELSAKQKKPTDENLVPLMEVHKKNARLRERPIIFLFNKSS